MIHLHALMFIPILTRISLIYNFQNFIHKYDMPWIDHAEECAKESSQMILLILDGNVRTVPEILLEPAAIVRSPVVTFLEDDEVINRIKLVNALRFLHEMCSLICMIYLPCCFHPDNWVEEYSAHRWHWLGDRPELKCLEWSHPDQLAVCPNRRRTWGHSSRSIPLFPEDLHRGGIGSSPNVWWWSSCWCP